MMQARAFEVLWQRACILGLAKLIRKRDDGDSDDTDEDEEGSNGGGHAGSGNHASSAEIDEVTDVLCTCHDLLSQIFYP